MIIIILFNFHQIFQLLIKIKKDILTSFSSEINRKKMHIFEYIHFIPSIVTFFQLLRNIKIQVPLLFFYRIALALNNP